MDKTTQQKPLKDAMKHMRRYNLENMPVVASEETGELVGVLDYRMVKRQISAEILTMRKAADGV